MLNYHGERFGKLTFRALAFCQSAPLTTKFVSSSDLTMLIIFEHLT